VQEGECKGVKLPDVHAAEASREHISPFSPSIGVTISNTANISVGTKGEMLEKNHRRKRL
jgi:hypothetical protein